VVDETVKAVEFSSREKKVSFWRKLSVPRVGFDVVTGVCLFLTIVHVAIVLRGGVEVHEGLYKWAGISVEGVKDGRYWQFFSYCLLHGGWFHLLLVLGGVFHLLTELLMGGEVFLVGASAAGMGLLLLLTILSPDSRMFPLPIKGKSLGLGVMVASVVLLLITPWFEIPYFESVGIWLWERGWGSIFRVSHACHLGGGLAGMVMAARVFGRKVTSESLRRERLKREGDLL